MKKLMKMYEDFCTKVVENDMLEETLNAINAMTFGERAAIIVAVAANLKRHGKQMPKWVKCCNWCLLAESVILCYTNGKEIKDYYEDRFKSNNVNVNND